VTIGQSTQVTHASLLQYKSRHHVCDITQLTKVQGNMVATSLKRGVLCAFVHVVPWHLVQALGLQCLANKHPHCTHPRPHPTCRSLVALSQQQCLLARQGSVDTPTPTSTPPPTPTQQAHLQGKSVALPRSTRCAGAAGSAAAGSHRHRSWPAACSTEGQSCAMQDTAHIQHSGVTTQSSNPRSTAPEPQPFSVHKAGRISGQLLGRAPRQFFQTSLHGPRSAFSSAQYVVLDDTVDQSASESSDGYHNASNPRPC
jgi:hypothetical protein